MSSVVELQRQAQAAPLNDVGHQSLLQLLQTQAARKRLDDRLKKAVETLTATAGQLNDRGTEADQRHTKKQQRLRSNGEEEGEEELNEHCTFQEKVRLLTQKMELGIRSIIDAQQWVDAVPDALRTVAVKTGAIAEATQRPTQGSISMTTQQSRQTAGRSENSDEDEDVHGEEHRGQISDQLVPSEAPTALLETALEKEASTWNMKSLTDRYANNNDYKGFYRTVYDAKNPGENALPIPHASLWFASQEGRQAEATVRARAAEEDVDDDIEIAGVRTRITCPLTQQPFRDPVTSAKCPHSFEKTAFFEALKRSGAEGKHVPWTDEQELELNQLRGQARARREKEIAIPIVGCPECSMPLRAEDVQPDPVLKRKVQRIEAERRRLEEATSDIEDEEDEAPRGTQRKPVGLGSSPPIKRARGRLSDTKAESGRSAASPSRNRVSSRTQMKTSGGATVVDLSEDEEDNDDDEEEEMDDE